MTQDKEQKDTLIHEFSFGYVGSKMVGKENTYVLRNKSGFIVATAEKYNNVLTSFSCRSIMCGNNLTASL